MITQYRKLYLIVENYSKTSSDISLLKQKRKYFVGNVTLRDISSKIEMHDQKVYLAGFRNGARTKLHYHQGDQTLVITKGKGVLVLYKKISSKKGILRIKPVSKTRLKQGDIVLIPKHTLHWHWAIQKNNFMHIALNAFYPGKESKPIWFESDFVSSASRLY